MEQSQVVSSRAANQALEEVEHDEEDAQTTSSADVGEVAANLSLAEKESKHVLLTRSLVLLVLVTVAATTAVLIYVYSSTMEDKSFKRHFKDLGNKVTTEFRDGVRRRVSAMEGFATQITSHAVAKNATAWPNIVLPDFERRAWDVMKVSEVVSITFLPIVTEAQRTSWERFSVENTQWVQQGLDLQGIPENEWVSPNLTVPHHVMNLTKQGFKIATGQGPFLPWWQFAPVFPLAGVLNYNTLSHPNRTKPIEAVLEQKMSIFSTSFDFRDTSGRWDRRSQILRYFLQHGRNEGEYRPGPVADMYVPVYKDFDGGELGAVLTSYVYWQVYFENILQDKDIGVDVVLENTCNETFTYQIDGNAAAYIGSGDRHDTYYDDLEYKTDYQSFVGVECNGTSIEGPCLYRIRVYPSDRLKEEYETNNPKNFAYIVAGTVLFSGVVFMLYDFLVERRQQLVMNTAVKSSAVVASLFPEEVRDRLLRGKATKRKNSTIMTILTSPLDNSVKTEVVEEKTVIADLYNNCTVQFCDIAGFTKWSSSREPQDVFHLLEALYKAFDRVAHRLGVFKVETIGDCYVAVTGLPLPQEDHAITMARFATECLIKVGKVASRLSEELGAETADLGVRIGMNSGPVTAGVLRGDKARFQLFGDTVNTAARMETTGEKGRVHLSSTTAKLLCAAGCEHWVSDRADEVEAKGKGKLKTFWLEPEFVEESTAGSFSERLLHC